MRDDRREAIASLRRRGKHDLAEYYERAIVSVPSPWSIDFIGDSSADP